MDGSLEAVHDRWLERTETAHCQISPPSPRALCGTPPPEYPAPHPLVFRPKCLTLHPLTVLLHANCPRALSH